MTNSELLFLTAVKYTGVKEKLNGWNEIIKKWIFASCKSIGLSNPKDDSEFAWCACFISNMLIESGIWAANKTHIVSARKFLDIGSPETNPEFGDIVILERGSGKGHIGLFINDINGKIKLLSGNSSDSVTIADYDPKRLLGYRRI